MTPQELRSEIEAEFTRRFDEIRFFQNCGAELQAEDALKYRKALIVFLYSHFEGYCKYALSAYLLAINKQKLTCRQVATSLAVAALSDIMSALRDGKRPHPFFSAEKNADPELQRNARDGEFIRRREDLMDVVVEIPEAAVDPQGNLKPHVLRKNLNRLGLSSDEIAKHDTAISELVERRNAIAHGGPTKGVEEKTYTALRDAVNAAMLALTACIHDAFLNKKYLMPDQVQYDCHVCGMP